MHGHVLYDMIDRKLECSHNVEISSLTPAPNPPSIALQAQNHHYHSRSRPRRQDPSRGVRVPYPNLPLGRCHLLLVLLPLHLPPPLHHLHHRPPHLQHLHPPPSHSHRASYQGHLAFRLRRRRRHHRFLSHSLARQQYQPSPSSTLALHSPLLRLHHSYPHPYLYLDPPSHGRHPQQTVLVVATGGPVLPLPVSSPPSSQ